MVGPRSCCCYYSVTDSVVLHVLPGCSVTVKSLWFSTVPVVRLRMLWDDAVLFPWPTVQPRCERASLRHPASVPNPRGVASTARPRALHPYKAYTARPCTTSGPVPALPLPGIRVAVPIIASHRPSGERSRLTASQSNQLEQQPRPRTVLGPVAQMSSGRWDDASLSSTVQAGEHAYGLELADEALLEAPLPGAVHAQPPPARIVTLARGLDFEEHMHAQRISERAAAFERADGNECVRSGMDTATVATLAVHKQKMEAAAIRRLASTGNVAYGRGSVGHRAGAQHAGLAGAALTALQRPSKSARMAQPSPRAPRKARVHADSDVT